MTDNKKGTDPFETAPCNDTPDSTAPEAERERGLFLPLAWAQLGGTVKPQPFRGKAKRKSRQAAIQQKRGHHGDVDPELLGLVLLALVAGLLLVGGA